MKKILSKTFTWLSLFVMILGFFFPNMTYIAYATEEDNNQSSFTNVIDGSINLNLDDRKEVIVSGSSNVKEIQSCFAAGMNEIVTETLESNSCKIVANNYGRTFIEISYINDNDEYKTEYFTVDVDFENYVQHMMNKIPDVYEYQDNISTFEYLRNLLPSNISVEYGGDDPYACYSSETDDCILKVNFSYYNRNEQYGIAYEYYTVEKRIKIKNEFIDYNGWSLSTQYVGTGESIDLEGNAPGNAKDYFFVSEDNTIATIDGSFKVVGVSPGKTNIRIINKDTLEYKSFTVNVHEVYATKTLEQALKQFEDTIEIDISNNLNLYQGYENEWIASNYFNETIKNINEKDIFSIYANGASCASTITDCYVDYYYNTNNGMVEGRTQLFDMVLRGIRVGSVSGYYQHGDIYYMYNGDTLTIDSIINKESDLLYGYDNDFFEVTEIEGIKQFKAKKEGYTKIDLYTTSGYMTSVYVNILFNKADVDTVRDFITNMQEVNIPYTKDNLTQTLMKDYLEAYIREGLQDNPVAKHLELKVTDLPNKTAIIDVYLKHNGNQLNNLSFYNKKVLFKYADEVDQELQNQLKEFKKNIKDKYILDFDLSMKLAASYEITNDFYNNLYKQAGIEEALQSNIFTTKIVYSGNVRYNKYLIGGAYYEIYIYKDNKLVDMIKTLVNTNFILDRGIVDEVTDDTNYIKEYIADKTGLDVTINHAFDNYYQVTYQGRNFHIMYNKINKVEAEHVQVYDLNDNIISLNIGEKKQFNYILYPFTATYFDMKFASSNEDVFTVDKNGLITGVGEGIAEISYSTGLYIESTLVIVGQTVKSYLNNLVVQLPLDNVKVTYNNYDESLEHSVSRAISRLIYDYEEMHGDVPFNFDIQVSLNGNTAYLNLCVDGICSDQYKAYYKMVGIYAPKEELKVKKGQTINSNIKFTEGDLSNLIFSIYDENIAKVDKQGRITGINKGYTYLSVFDKYHDYFNEFVVYVDYEDFNNEIILEVANKVYDVDGLLFNSYNEIEWTISSELMMLMGEDGFEPYKIFGPDNGYSSYYDEEEGIVTYEFSDPNETVIDVKVNLVGIFTSTNQVNLNIGDTYTDDLKVYTGGEVTATSSDTSICTVDGLTVTAVSNGVCDVTYKNNGHYNIQSFIIGVGENNDELKELLDAIPNTFDIKLDEFDMSKRADYNYTYMYDAAVAYHLQKLFPYEGEIGFNVSQVALSDNGDEVDVSLVLSKRIRYGKGTTNVVIATTDNKTIKLNYLGHSTNWQEKETIIKNKMKNKYLLSADQMIEFMFTSGDSEQLHKYSDFEKDLEEVCSGCEYVLGGRGGTDAGDGVINVGFEYFVFDNEEPVFFGNTGFIGYVYLDLYEIKDDEHIEREVKGKLKDAYIKHKHHRTMLHSTVKSSMALLTADEENYEVELSLISRKGNIYNYDVKLDGKEFQTSVYLNILTEDKVYSNNVLVGDIDLDGNINITDLVRLRKYLAGSETLTEEQLTNADVDKDGNVNITDLVRIRKYLAGSEEL